MFQLQANGTPKVVIAELERQSNRADVTDQPIRNKIIGFTRDAVAAAESTATVALQASGTHEKLESLTLTVK